jgi:hypothetical protein
MTFVSATNCYLFYDIYNRKSIMMNLRTVTQSLPGCLLKNIRKELLELGLDSG